MNSQSDTKSSTDKLWTRSFIFICLSNFTVFVSFQLLLPTLPLYVKEIGGEDNIIGWIVGIFTLSSVIIRPWMGRLVDNRGRQGIYIWGLIFFLFTTFLYSWTTSIIWLFLLRIAHGLTWGSVTTTSGTVATDLIPSSRRGEGMGYFGLFINLSMAIGPAIGLWVVNQFHFDALFWLATAMVLASLLPASLVRYPRISTKPGKESKRQPLLSKGALSTSLIMLLITFTYGGVVIYIPLFAEAENISQVSWFFIVFAISVMLIRPLSGKWYDQKGPQHVIVGGLLAMGISLVLLSITSTLPMLLTAAAFYGIGYGAVQPALQAWTIDRVPPHTKGSANATFFAAFDLGLGTGSITLGTLAGIIGYHQMFLTAILFLFVAFFLFLFIVHREAKKPVID
ncbi:MFS transporter [Kroppenstedtia pulmonis]|uniref:MFS transporter n=1 Tax=Kroppenstedtia pulmonis TaxID=1380685 RepID=A0A7D4BUS1_9BACL|nr:MFS transporter [Kroppenstedtia pulmonis]QKG83333.1 MFS transporter [Kroppenstedtia pulmonis]